MLKKYGLGLMFFILAAIFTYFIVRDMPTLFQDATTLWQYFTAALRIVLVLVFFNFGVTQVFRKPQSIQKSAK